MKENMLIKFTYENFKLQNLIKISKIWKILYNISFDCK